MLIIIFAWFGCNVRKSKQAQSCPQWDFSQEEISYSFYFASKNLDISHMVPQGSSDSTKNYITGRQMIRIRPKNQDKANITFLPGSFKSITLNMDNTIIDSTSFKGNRYFENLNKDGSFEQPYNYFLINVLFPILKCDSKNRLQDREDTSFPFTMDGSGTPAEGKIIYSYEERFDGVDNLVFTSEIQISSPKTTGEDSRARMTIQGRGSYTFSKTTSRYEYCEIHLIMEYEFTSQDKNTVNFTRTDATYKIKHY